jgi:formylglycine-generating enzyme required for sulfatase activity
VIRRPFFLSETEVTVGQFRKFVRATGYQTDAQRGVPDGDQGRGAFATTPDGERDWSEVADWENPFPNVRGFRLREDQPVVQVSWNDAQQFCAHFGLHLPTEAQWEYAARAGGRESYPWGSDPARGKGHANVRDASFQKRFPGASAPFPFDDGAALIAPTRRYRPNDWGLYDMIGNVEEWCQDAYGPYPGDGADEAAAPGTASAGRILRGGAWNAYPHLTRSASSTTFAPSSRRDFVGFRVVMIPDS